jgi:hypothetical protein
MTKKKAGKPANTKRKAAAQASTSPPEVLYGTWQTGGIMLVDGWEHVRHGSFVGMYRRRGTIVVGASRALVTEQPALYEGEQVGRAPRDEKTDLPRRVYLLASGVWMTGYAQLAMTSIEDQSHGTRMFAYDLDHIVWVNEQRTIDWVEGQP